MTDHQTSALSAKTSEDFDVAGNDGPSEHVTDVEVSVSDVLGKSVTKLDFASTLPALLNEVEKVEIPVRNEDQNSAGEPPIEECGSSRDLGVEGDAAPFETEQLNDGMDEDEEAPSGVEEEDEEDLSQDEEDLESKVFLSYDSGKSTKKRRRILVCSDGESSTDEADGERDRILSDPEDGLAPDVIDELDDELLRNERPGPKSKKASTKILKELQTRNLLQSAIVIPAVNGAKKRKKRIIDSDDEESGHFEPENLSVDVDDIGLVPEDAFNEDDDAELGILVNAVEPLPIAESLEVFEDQNMDEDVKDSGHLKEGSSDVKDGSSAAPKPQTADPSADDTSIVRDSGNSTDSNNQPQSEVQSKPKAGNSKQDPFLEPTSSSEEEYLPNDLYFGTPDRSQLSSRGSEIKQKSEGSTASSNPRRSSPSSETNSSVTDESSEEDRHSKPIPRKTAQSKKVVKPAARVPIKPVAKPPVPQVQSPPKKRKKGHIPNEIYFDIKVPLHVLYSYDNDSDSESSEEEPPEIKPPPVRKANPLQNVVRVDARPSSSRTVNRPAGNAHSPTRDGVITTMKEYLRLAGITGVKFNKLWEGCKSHQDRANRILELLHEKGLEGEPTIAKCKELRKQLSAKKEIAELDTSVIIQAEGRTRRSTARAATRRNYVYDEDKNVQETLKKIKNIIDSDSDID